MIHQQKCDEEQRPMDRNELSLLLNRCVMNIQKHVFTMTSSSIWTIIEKNARRILSERIFGVVEDRQ